MSTPKDHTAERTARSAPRRSSVRLLRDVPMATALVVALVSALTLTAYDKPLDRQALTPSVMEFMDGGNLLPVSAPQAGGAQPHPMLLRYDLGSGEAPVITWHAWQVPLDGRGQKPDSML